MLFYILEEDYQVLTIFFAQYTYKEVGPFRLLIKMQNA